MTWCKVLALPEHFSPKHLQAIVDGKMKDGDKVLVECVDQGEEDWMGDNETGQPFWNSQYFIKLNSFNQVTLHKVEEKMYSRQELERAWDAGFNRGQVIGGEVDYNKVDTTPTKEQWFEQNVK